MAQTTASQRRWELLGGPGGYLTALPVGDARRSDRYRRWVTLARVNRPMTRDLVREAQGWEVAVFGNAA